MSGSVSGEICIFESPGAAFALDERVYRAIVWRCLLLHALGKHQTRWNDAILQAAKADATINPA